MLCRRFYLRGFPPVTCHLPSSFSMASSSLALAVSLYSTFGGSCAVDLFCYEPFALHLKKPFCQHGAPDVCQSKSSLVRQSALLLCCSCFSKSITSTSCQVSSVCQPHG